MSDAKYLQLPHSTKVYTADTMDAADQFVSNIFGVSNIDETGNIRIIGDWMGGLRRAVFWMVVVTNYENADCEVHSNYDVTCIDFVTHERYSERYLIIRPDVDLSLCHIVKPPTITFIDAEGETVAAGGNIGRCYIVGDRIIYKAHVWSWRPCVV